MTRPPARAAVFLLAFTIAATTAIAPAVAAGPPPVVHGQAAGPGLAAAGWLARQMVDGSHFTVTYDGVTYPDQGLTIDAIDAFAATGTASNYAARAIAWLARPHILSNYIGNGTTASYAGATANLLLATEVAGVSPTTFGGVNLPARLASLLTPSGRYSDHSKYGDYSNAFSQALAVIAMSRLGGAPAKAVSFLAASECANGGFPLDFAQKTCASYPDATAMDVQALLAAGQWGQAQRGLAWLARVQQRDGGFIAPPAKVPNSNSTGLAGEAFAAGGWFMRAVFARSFLLSVQVGCSGKPANQGAIAYDTSGFKASTAAFATAQAILGVADVDLDRLTAAGSHPGDPHLSCSS
jgi:hypothetical protein